MNVGGEKYAVLKSHKKCEKSNAILQNHVCFLNDRGTFWGDSEFLGFVTNWSGRFPSVLGGGQSQRVYRSLGQTLMWGRS